MKLVSLFGLTVALVACGDATNPVELRPKQSTLASSNVASEYLAIDLGTLGGPASFARGINESGHVVGESLNAVFGWRGFVWTPAEDGMTGTMVALSTLGGD